MVLPAFNLAEQIVDSIEAVAASLPAAEIVVVDDGSEDGTSTAVHDLRGGVHNVVLMQHEVNRGKGAALRTGAGVARGEIVVFLDADLDIPPAQLPGLLDEFASRRCDVLVGTKHHHMSGGRYPWKRRVLSRVFALVTKLLFRLPVAETQTGLKIFRAAVLADVLPRLQVERYAFDLELLVKAHRAGYEISSAPVDLRVGASSAPLRLATLWEMARDTARILWWSWRR